MRKLRTRILAGGAVAVFAAATGFAVTSAAGTTTTVRTAALTSSSPKAATTLSITAGESTVKAGEKDSISGTLLAAGSPARGKAVGLYRYNSQLGRWRLIRIKLTSKTGTVAFIVHPEITREYRLMYHGNPTLAASASGTVTITVSPPAAKRVTSLSISATPSSVAAGHTTQIAGVLSTSGRPLAHRIVSLYRYDTATKKWVRVAITLTGPKGGVRFARKPSATATFELVYPGGPLLTGAHSGRTTVTVTG
jgi:5-hydroxyisourate hydrolase-like protein (transthyretin family)